MITAAVQRWRAHRDSYRPAGEPIRTAEYDVAPIERDTIARAFVEAHHYSASYPAARARFGLYRRAELVGVAVFSQQLRDASHAVLGCPGAGVDLGRFVLLDEVPANGETWFLARAFELLHREGFEGVIAFSDPTPRRDADGRVSFRGHIGTIYQAHNAVFVGRSKPERLDLLPDGTVLHRRNLDKIIKGVRGAAPSIARLVAAGADPLEGDPRAWLATWLPRVTRPLRHPGNLKYAWRLSKRGRRALPASLPYPKVQVAA